MNIVHSRKVRPAESSAKIVALLDTIAEAQLREWARSRSKTARRRTGCVACLTRWDSGWIARANIPTSWRFRKPRFENAILVGAHYDSVPMCPGADDNGSAVAAMLGCAAACSLWRPRLPVVFVAFNREEDGLRGSRDFVDSYLLKAAFSVRCAHILEMLGYASSEPGSQRVPTGLPIKISDKGDFLGLLANGRSRTVMDFVLHRAGTYVPELPVTALNVKLGLEKYFPVLSRSDHAPFWAQKIPAVMWTDTSEFRNHNYHRHTDTPDTLNFRFLRQVTQLLTACVIQQAEPDSANELAPT